GERFKLVKRPEESGTSERSDFPAVRVRFLKKGTGEPLGSYTLSLWFYRNATNRIPVFRFPPQRLRVGEKTYTVELRPQRVYKPYAIHLLSFTHKKYIGTETPRDFTSVVRLEEPSLSGGREVKISMNDPL